MRSMGIAVGVIVVVLTVAIALRPGQPAGTVGGDADNASESGPAAEVPPRPLAAEDVQRIMELRSEFGSAARWMGGEKVVAAAFERELRQLAGLDQAETPAQLAEAQTLSPAASSPGEGGASVEVLRQAAAALDNAANRAEESEDYGRADHLRSLSSQLRQLARRAAALSQESLPAADDAAAGLIDKSQARQAQ
jgi:hypothetical protein